jgi:hypothetical protein
VDGETSVVKFGHQSRAYLEGLTKFWGFWGSSAPAYSPFCTLKTHMETYLEIQIGNTQKGTHETY